MPFGAEPAEGGGTRFRLWAPAARTVALCIESESGTATESMAAASDGWFERVVPQARPGTRYGFNIDGRMRVPDPASRFQPEDVHGSSEVVDPLAFDWTDEQWRGRPWEEAIFYETHVGAFTPEGTFKAMIGRLDHLVELGVTALELMPLADSPGARNWGYDGVYPFAPEASYGRPEDLKALVDAAHARGLMVFLDVVYNHFGPEGNYLHVYAPQFFTDRHKTPWGAAINFDGDEPAVRAFFIHNALYWLEEYHFDGLRLDAVHAICDDSRPDILTELAETVKAEIDSARAVHLVLENDKNESRYLERDEEDRPRWYSAQWNDDLHHCLHVLTTGEADGYYADYADAPVQRLGRALAEGFVYQGERSRYRGGAPRGEPSAQLPASAFVTFLQNHDQIGNRAFGERIAVLAEAPAIKAAMAILFLSPAPPLLFMGEEWNTHAPFPFFCEFEPELADKVREGRRREFARFPKFQDPALVARIPDPNALETFETAKLDWAESKTASARAWLDFYRALIALRHAEIIPRLKGLSGHAARFYTIGGRGLHVSWRLGDEATLILCCNLGPAPLENAGEAPGGRVLFATEKMPEGLQARCWPPWSVAWLRAPASSSVQR